MLNVSFQAQNAKELHEKIHSFCKEFGIDGENTKQAALPLRAAPAAAALATAVPEPASAPASVPVLSPVADAPAAKPRGRPRKEQAVTDFTSEAEETAPAAPAPSPAAAPATAALPADPVAAKQAVTNALTQVNGKHGLVVARGVLMKFGTDRLSSLPAERYPEFSALCSKVIAAADTAAAQALLA